MVHYCAIDYIISQLNIHHFFACSMKMDMALRILVLWHLQCCKTLSTEDASHRFLCRRKWISLPGSADSLEYLWLSRALPAVRLASLAPSSLRADSFWVSLVRHSPEELSPGPWRVELQQVPESRFLESSAYAMLWRLSWHQWVTPSVTRCRLQPWRRSLHWVFFQSQG